MRESFNAITIIAKGGLLNVIKSECEASAAFDPTSLPANQYPAREKFTGIWDTGATNTVITQEVVDRCLLKPTGVTQVHGIHGLKPTLTFLINVWIMEGRIHIYNLPVTLGELPAGSHLLIGMDIIARGDCAITNVGGNTVFSFRIPSLKVIDYYAEAMEQNAQVQRIADKKARKSNKHRTRYHR
jgi:hypothetical protein